MFCYRDYQLSTRFNQQNEKSTSNYSTDNIYLAKENVKLMMMLNRNMQISILKIKKESVITLLNKLPHLSDSRYLKK